MTDETFDLAAGLRELCGVLLAEETIETTMARVVAVACRCAPGEAGAGATIVLDSAGSLSTAAATDDRVRHAADRQLDAREGPVIVALKTGETQVVGNVCDGADANDDGPLLAALGMVSTAVAPIKVGTEVVGALAVFDGEPDAFTPDHVESIELLAAQAGMLLGNLRLHEDCLERVRQLQEALDSRVVIEQAKGILMERHRIGADAAFDRLRQQSQQENRRLRHLASELVAAVAPGNSYAEGRG